MTHIYIETETYSVSALPDNHPERGFYELTLRRLNDGQWGVTRFGRWWDRAGNSEFLGGGLRDEEAEHFLMSLTEAREVAGKVAPTLRVNGGPTAVEVLESPE